MTVEVIVIIVLAFGNFLSPIIIKWLDYRQQIKLQEQNDLLKEKVSVANEFINATNDCFICNGGLSLHQMTNYQKCANKLLFYFSDISEKEIDSITSVLDAPDMREKDKALRPLIVKLSTKLFEKQ